MTVELSREQARLLRTEGQHLHASTERASLLEVVESVLGINAQRSPAMLLSLRARIRGLKPVDVLKAIDPDRDLVRTWAARGTIHLMRADDVAWMVPLLGPRFIETGRRRRIELGLSEDLLARGLKEIRAILGRSGPLTRRELMDRLSERGIELNERTQAPYHLIHYAAMRGLVCIGPERENGESTYVLLEKWSGKVRQGTKAQSLARLAGRYLQGYGPAGIDDFAYWTGLTMADARAAFKVFSGDAGLAEALVGGRSLFLPPGYQRIPGKAAPRERVVRLLPAFDSYLLGYGDRGLLIDQARRGEIYHGGQVVPAVVVDGEIAGTWRYERRGRRLVLDARPFSSFTGEIRKSISEEAEDIGRFLGYPVSLSIQAGPGRNAGAVLSPGAQIV